MTNLVNKIKIYTNLIELFHFEIYIFLFLSKYVIIFGKITWINLFIITQKKNGANMYVFLYYKNTSGE